MLDVDIAFSPSFAMATVKMNAGESVQANAFRLSTAQPRTTGFEKRLHGHARSHPPMAYGRPWK